MQKAIFTFLFVCVIIVQSCTSEKKYFDAPISDLGHIDLILDSVSYFSLMNNSFLTNEFALFFKDTVAYGGKPSYDLYLGGQENFFHISVAKGYWQDKAGSGVLVFQTKKPDKKDSLYSAWKQYYPDSLFSHVYNGHDFNLGEVMVYQKKDSLQPLHPIFFSNLTSYSSQSYRNWGFDDPDVTNGISMNQFMTNWDSSVKQKLFKKIKELHLQVTAEEYKDLSSALKTVGYAQANGKFIHPSNPPIYYSVTETNAIPKYTKIEIELSRAVATANFDIGTMYRVEMYGTKMNIIAK